MMLRLSEPVAQMLKWNVFMAFSTLKMTDDQLVNKIPVFMEPDDSLPLSQTPKLVFILWQSNKLTLSKIISDQY